MDLYARDDTIKPVIGVRDLTVLLQKEPTMKLHISKVASIATEESAIHCWAWDHCQPCVRYLF